MDDLTREQQKLLTSMYKEVLSVSPLYPLTKQITLLIQM